MNHWIVSGWCFNQLLPWPVTFILQYFIAFHNLQPRFKGLSSPWERGWKVCTFNVVIETGNCYYYLLKLTRGNRMPCPSARFLWSEVFLSNNVSQKTHPRACSWSDRPAFWLVDKETEPPRMCSRGFTTNETAPVFHQAKTANMLAFCRDYSNYTWHSIYGGRGFFKLPTFLSISRPGPGN